MRKTMNIASLGRIPESKKMRPKPPKYYTSQCNPPPPPTPGKYGALAIKQNKTVIMPHIQGTLILSNPLPNVNKFPHPRAKLRLICHMQITLPTESVCARLAQLVRSMTAIQKVPGSIPRLIEGWTLGDFLSPRRPWTGTLGHWSSLSMFYRRT